MSPVVSSEALIRLIEIELVNQFQRFIKKHISKAPRNCRFNAIINTPDGGYLRLCKCPLVNTPTQVVHAAATLVSGKPCTTLYHAKKCPVYQHYTGVPDEQVMSALIEEFFARLTDPNKRAVSFKTLHTLWILLHETSSFNLSWFTRVQLKLYAKVFKRRYIKYLIKNTPAAELDWVKLTSNFNLVLTNAK